MFGCPIRTYESHDQTVELVKTTGMFLAWFKYSKLSGSVLMKKI